MTPIRTVTHRELNAWILERRDEGFWCSPCAAKCGVWFAQKRNLKGRRAFLCGKQICHLWRRWQREHGIAPPAWLVMRWQAYFGTAERVDGAKRHPEERLCVSEAA